MDPRRLRRSLLGAIRYGKPLVIDMGGLVGWETLQRRLDTIRPDLAKVLLTHEIVTEREYMKLVESGDGEVGGS